MEDIAFDTDYVRSRYGDDPAVARLCDAMTAALSRENDLRGRVLVLETKLRVVGDECHAAIGWTPMAGKGGG